MGDRRRSTVQVVLTELTDNIRQGRLRGKPHLKVEIHPEFALKYEIPIALAHKIR